MPPIDPDAAAWALGALAESEAARMIQTAGFTVLPTFSAISNTEHTKAPMVRSNAGDVAVAMDLLCFRAGGQLWCDVKGKSQPSWFRKLRRWEHGIDLVRFQGYRRIESETGVCAWLILRETSSPADPKQESTLTGPVTWLTITLKEVERIGEHRPLWPGGASDSSRRGTDGRGGWLWPRASMAPWRIELAHFDEHALWRATQRPLF